MPMLEILTALQSNLKRCATSRSKLQALSQAMHSARSGAGSASHPSPPISDGYLAQHAHLRSHHQGQHGAGSGAPTARHGMGQQPAPSSTHTHVQFHYRDCQRNVAASMGGCAVDGCGEFMPAGEEGTPAALRCAACECHRSFHRRVEDRAPRSTLAHLPSSSSMESVPDLMLLGPQLAAAAAAAESTGGPDSEKRLNQLASLTERSLQALEHNARVMMATAESLKVLQHKHSQRVHGGQHPHPPADQCTTAAASIGAPQPGYWGRNDNHGGAAEGAYFGVDEGWTGGEFSGGLGCSQLIDGLPSQGHSVGGKSGGDGVMGYAGAVTDPSREYAMGGHAKKKRKRTKISDEQKEKLAVFAQRVGWTVVGQQKEEIDAACAEIGIEPKTLRYWIHNSKQKAKKQEPSEPST
eukprot:jgi/Mesen1/1569/ME000134S00684